jgi:hypothetical protein
MMKYKITDSRGETLELKDEKELLYFLNKQFDLMKFEEVN